MSTIWELASFANNIAVIDEKSVRYTYNDLKEKTDELASFIGERCLVFVLASNTIGSLVGYVGLVNNNIVPLMLDGHLDDELLNNLIETYRPKYIWCQTSKVTEFGFETVFSVYDYSLLKTNCLNNYPMNEELALLLTTSGSTGSPKLVRQTYKNIFANTKSIVEYLRLNKNEKPITTLPMNYTYGISIINTHLFVGATLLLTNETIFSREFWKMFREQGATSFGGVPYTYEMLDKLRFFRMDLPSLKTMTQAGGKISLDLHKKFADYAEATNKKFVVMYGQTEATARMAYLPFDKAIEKCGSMGIAIPGGKFELIDQNGNLIKEPETVGELVYEGDNVTFGYAVCGDDLIKGDDNHGRLLTGDMAKFDEDGFYYVVGRKKRFLKMFGKRVNLDEMERMIKSDYPDIECACCGLDDNMYIFITNESFTDRIKNYVSEKTGINFSGFKVRFVESIPKNESGKTKYLELEKHYDK